MERTSSQPRYVRSMQADDLARLLDGADHAEPEVVRCQRRFTAHPKLDRRVAVACVIIALLTAVYFAVQLTRAVLS
jgi:hypothetical protein